MKQLDDQVEEPPLGKGLITKMAAAKRLNISTRTLDRIAANGGIEKIHIGRAVRFRLVDIERIEEFGV